MIITLPRFVRVVRREKLRVRWSFTFFSLSFWLFMILGSFIVTVSFFPTYLTSFQIGVVLSVLTFLLDMIWQRDYIKKQTERIWTPLIDLEAYQSQDLPINSNVLIDQEKSGSAIDSSSSLNKSKLTALVIYGLGFTLILDVVMTTYNHFEQVFFSTFWIVILSLYLFNVYYQYQSQYFTFNFAAMIKVNFGLFLSILALDYVTPSWKFWDFMNLTNNYSNYILIDDEEYYEDYLAEVDPVFGGTDGSGYYSNFKYYVDGKENITRHILPEGRIARVDEERYCLIDESGATINLLNINSCPSNEVAFIYGYKPLGSVTECMLPFRQHFFAKYRP